MAIDRSHCSTRSAPGLYCRLPGQRGSARDYFLRYTPVSVWTVGGQACSFQITAPNARTVAKIGIGDALAAAKQTYPRLRCATANGPERLVFRYCSGRLRTGSYLWFGGDPINDIEFGASPLTE
jgi:hypothetical protein